MKNCHLRNVGQTGRKAQCFSRSICSNFKKSNYKFIHVSELENYFIIYKTKMNLTILKFRLTMYTFKIPQGDHSEMLDTYRDLQRRAMNEAGRRRENFIAYKNLLRRFHIHTTENDQTRLLLQTVGARLIIISQNNC